MASLMPSTERRNVRHQPDSKRAGNAEIFMMYKYQIKYRRSSKTRNFSFVLFSKKFRCFIYFFLFHFLRHLYFYILLNTWIAFREHEVKIICYEKLASDQMWTKNMFSFIDYFFFPPFSSFSSCCCCCRCL